jgi:hypothetical protein
MCLENLARRNIWNSDNYRCVCRFCRELREVYYFNLMKGLISVLFMNIEMCHGINTTHVIRLVSC